MDKFGLSRVSRGPPGPPGRDAFDLHLWCPEALLQLFRESEVCTYFFNTAADGLITQGKGKPVGLKDRYGKKHAMCLKKFEKPIKEQEIYVLPLQGALYKIDRVMLALHPPSMLVVALTFKVSKSLTGKHYIFSNESQSRGVYITKDFLNICGTDPLLLKYEYRDWNRLIIQYSNFSSIGGCIFVLNGQRGFFIRNTEVEEDHAIYLGGHPKEKQPANVEVSNFEIFSKTFDLKTKEAQILPWEIIDLIDKNYIDRVS